MVLLPNQWSATPRTYSDTPLRLWNTGDALTAGDLNDNFLFLLSLIGAAATAANTPDAGALDALELCLQLDEKIAAIEQHLGEEQRRQTRFGYAPLAVVAALKQQLDGLQGPLMAEAAALHGEVAREHARESSLEGRIAVLEEKPAPPTVAQLQGLEQALEASRREGAFLHHEVARLREEIAQLQPMALHRELDARLDAARTDNLRAVNALVERIEALEKKE